jgi:predicted NACHT family NTPase
LYVDNPDAKRRFLRQIAYHLHSSEQRRRNIDTDELREVYEQSLGVWGYNVNFEEVLKDLVVGSGVLIEERQGTYSFGHLTFQEHLAGEYITSNYSVAQISSLLNDDWWREPLNFYASMRGDITELLDLTMRQFTYMAYSKQLSRMAKYAPYTSPGAVQSLEDFISDTHSNDTPE